MDTSQHASIHQPNIETGAVMKNNKKTIEAIAGAVCFVVIPLLLCFDVIDFLWTGFTLWAVIIYIEVNFLSEKKSGEKEPIQISEEQQEFEIDDLPGYGLLIWNSKKGLPVRFSYVDAHGKKTERTVSLNKLFKDNPKRFYFQGKCSLRKEQRTFVSNRIENIYISANETISIHEFINSLAGYKAYGTNVFKQGKSVSGVEE